MTALVLTLPLHTCLLVSPVVTPLRSTRITSPPTCCSVDEPESPLTLALQAVPVAISIGAGVPIFSAIYVPFVALGRAAEASPAAVLFLSTLLFAAADTLFEVPPTALPQVAVAANLGVAGLLLWSEVQARALVATRDPTLDEDDFARFDRRLKEASNSKPSQRRSRPPRLMCSTEPAGGEQRAPVTSDGSGGGGSSGSGDGRSDVGGASGNFDFSAMGDAFEGKRVMETRAKMAEREDRRATPREVLQNIVNQGPGTALLILVFGVLTIGDVLFNFSRSFICVLPDLCEPVVANAMPMDMEGGVTL